MFEGTGLSEEEEEEEEESEEERVGSVAIPPEAFAQGFLAHHWAEGEKSAILIVPKLSPSIQIRVQPTREAVRLMWESVPLPPTSVLVEEKLRRIPDLDVDAIIRSR